MDQEAEARRKLADLIDRHGEDYAGLSRLLGRNPAYIQQYIKRGTPRRLSEGDRRRLARYFAVDERELGAPEIETNATVAIPRLDIGASAGPGALAEDDRQGEDVRFDPAWLKLMGLPPSNLSLIRVRGDSMSPTLDDGDEILVQGASGAPLEDGIHVIRMDGTLMVKRIAMGPGGRISVLSDNPAYRDWPDTLLSEVDFVGRVVWMGRRL